MHCNPPQDDRILEWNMETIDITHGGAGYNVFGSFSTIELSVEFYVTFLSISGNLTSFYVFF